MWVGRCPDAYGAFYIGAGNIVVSHYLNSMLFRISIAAILKNTSIIDMKPSWFVDNQYTFYPSNFHTLVCDSN